MEEKTMPQEWKGSDTKQRGLCIDEQAHALWAICRWSNNPEACPASFMTELKGACPFTCECDEVWPDIWAEFLRNRVTPQESK